MSTLLKYKGLELSEPMVFGLAGAICFAYLPFLKMGNMPLVSYRMFPGHIIKNIPRRLGVEYFRKTYKDQDQAMAELDEFLADRRLVGLQTSAYFTTYFPPEMRFQFNAHNIIIIGKEGDEYLVSDPVFDHIERIKAADLKKARFAKGLSAPKGLIHYPAKCPERIDLEKLIKKSIKKTVNMMLYAPFAMDRHKRDQPLIPAYFETIAQTECQIHPAFSGKRRAHAGGNRNRWRWIPVYICRLFAGGA